MIRLKISKRFIICVALIIKIISVNLFAVDIEKINELYNNFFQKTPIEVTSGTSLIDKILIEDIIEKNLNVIAGDKNIRINALFVQNELYINGYFTQNIFGPKLTEAQIEAGLRENFKSLLSGSQKINFDILILISSGADTTFIKNKNNLKDKFIKNYLIDYKLLWSDIITAAGEVEGFEFDASSEKHSETESIIKTIPRIDSKEEKGFITKYEFCLKMKQDEGIFVTIETIFTVSRKRASAGNDTWQTRYIGENFRGSSFKGVNNPRSSIPLVEAISKTIIK